MDSTTINEAAYCAILLAQGKLILYPTDTIWGIGCDAINNEAVQKIYALKRRVYSKSMIVLITPEILLDNYVDDPAPEIAAYLAKQTLPTTAVYKNAKNVAGSIISEDGSVAIRITRDAFCAAIINQTHTPLVSTSANISGVTSPCLFNQVSSEIKNGVDYIVQHRRSDFRNTGASKIIALNEERKIIHLR